MRIIHNRNFRDYTKPAQKLNGIKTTVCGYQVDAYAIIDIDGQITVEASNNNFVSTVYSNTVSTDSIVDITPITAAKWRITADAGVTIGQLYIGQLINIKDPSWPYAFEKHTVADDRKTVGGIGYSKIGYTKYAGQFNWQGIQVNELADWRNWYVETNGYRRGFIIEEPENKTIHLVRGRSLFPLTGEQYNNRSGRLDLEEYG